MKFPYQKTIALAVTLTVFLTSILPSGWSAPPELVPPAPSFNIKVPSDLASVETLFHGKGPSVIHIQTAHGNFDSQKKTQTLLHYLKQQYGFKTLFVEGSPFDLVPETLRFLPERSDLTMKINDELTRKAIVKGSELFLIEARDAKAYGIENLETYKANGEAFKAVLRAQPKTQKFIQALDLQIERLSSAFLNKDLRAALSRLEGFQEGRLDFASWLAELNALALKHLKLEFTNARSQTEWPMLTRYFKVLEWEKKTDPAALALEKERFLNLIKKFPQAVQIKALLEFRSQETGSPETLERLVESLALWLPKNFDAAAYPNLNRRIGIRLLQSEIQGKPLGEEVDRLTDRVLAGLSQGEKEEKVLEALKDYRRLHQLFRLELTPSDYEMILAKKENLTPSRMAARFREMNTQNRVQNLNFEHLSELDDLYQKALEFYRFVKQRDQIMLQNLTEKMKEKHIEKAVVITGGFHSGPFEKYFHDAGANYALLSPKITQTPAEGERQAYIDAVFQENPKIKQATYDTPSIALRGAELVQLHNMKWLRRQIREAIRSSVPPEFATRAEERAEGSEKPRLIRSESRPDSEPEISEAIQSFFQLKYNLAEKKFSPESILTFEKDGEKFSADLFGFQMQGRNAFRIHLLNQSKQLLGYIDINFFTDNPAAAVVDMSHPSRDRGDTFVEPGLWVSESYQKKGLGRLLLQLGMAFAKTRQASTFEAWGVYEDSKGFYEKTGFKNTPVRVQNQWNNTVYAYDLKGQELPSLESYNLRLTSRSEGRDLLRDLPASQLLERVVGNGYLFKTPNAKLERLGNSFIWNRVVYEDDDALVVEYLNAHYEIGGVDQAQIILAFVPKKKEIQDSFKKLEEENVTFQMSGPDAAEHYTASLDSVDAGRFSFSESITDSVRSLENNYLRQNSDWLKIYFVRAATTEKRFVLPGFGKTLQDRSYVLSLPKEWQAPEDQLEEPAGDQELDLLRRTYHLSPTSTALKGDYQKFSFEIGAKISGIEGRPVLITHLASGKKYFHPRMNINAKIPKGETFLLAEMIHPRGGKTQVRINTDTGNIIQRAEARSVEITSAPVDLDELEANPIPNGRLKNLIRDLSNQAEGQGSFAKQDARLVLAYFASGDAVDFEDLQPMKMISFDFGGEKNKLQMTEELALALVPIFHQMTEDQLDMNVATAYLFSVMVKKKLLSREDGEQTEYSEAIADSITSTRSRMFLNVPDQKRVHDLETLKLDMRRLIPLYYKGIHGREQMVYPEMLGFMRAIEKAAEAMSRPLAEGEEPLEGLVDLPEERQQKVSEKLSTIIDDLSEVVGADALVKAWELDDVELLHLLDFFYQDGLFEDINEHSVLDAIWTVVDGEALAELFRTDLKAVEAFLMSLKGSDYAFEDLARNYPNLIVPDYPRRVEIPEKVDGFVSMLMADMPAVVKNAQGLPKWAAHVPSETFWTPEKIKENVLRLINVDTHSERNLNNLEDFYRDVKDKGRGYEFFAALKLADDLSVKTQDFRGFWAIEDFFHSVYWRMAYFGYLLDHRKELKLTLEQMADRGQMHRRSMELARIFGEKYDKEGLLRAENRGPVSEALLQTVSEQVQGVLRPVLDLIVYPNTVSPHEKFLPVKAEDLKTLERQNIMAAGAVIKRMLVEGEAVGKIAKTVEPYFALLFQGYDNEIQKVKAGESDRNLPNLLRNYRNREILSEHLSEVIKLLAKHYGVELKSDSPDDAGYQLAAPQPGRDGLRSGAPAVPVKAKKKKEEKTPEKENVFLSRVFRGLQIFWDYAHPLLFNWVSFMGLVGFGWYLFYLREKAEVFGAKQDAEDFKTQIIMALFNLVMVIGGLAVSVLPVAIFKFMKTHSAMPGGARPREAARPIERLSPDKLKERESRGGTSEASGDDFWGDSKRSESREIHVQQISLMSGQPEGFFAVPDEKGLLSVRFLIKFEESHDLSDLKDKVQAWARYSLFDQEGKPTAWSEAATDLPLKDIIMAATDNPYVFKFEGRIQAPAANGKMLFNLRFLVDGKEAWMTNRTPDNNAVLSFESAPKGWSYARVPQSGLQQLLEFERHFSYEDEALRWTEDDFNQLVWSTRNVAEIILDENQRVVGLLVFVPEREDNSISRRVIRFSVHPDLNREEKEFVEKYLIYKYKQRSLLNLNVFVAYVPEEDKDQLKLWESQGFTSRRIENLFYPGHHGYRLTFAPEPFPGRDHRFGFLDYKMAEDYWERLVFPLQTRRALSAKVFGEEQPETSNPFAIPAVNLQPEDVNPSALALAERWRESTTEQKEALLESVYQYDPEIWGKYADGIRPWLLWLLMDRDYKVRRKVVEINDWYRETPQGGKQGLRIDPELLVRHFREPWISVQALGHPALGEANKQSFFNKRIALLTLLVSNAIPGRASQEAPPEFHATFHLIYEYREKTRALLEKLFHDEALPSFLQKGPEKWMLDMLEAVKSGGKYAAGDARALNVWEGLFLAFARFQKDYPEASNPYSSTDAPNRFFFVSILRDYFETSAPQMAILIAMTVDKLKYSNDRSESREVSELAGFNQDYRDGISTIPGLPQTQWAEPGGKRIQLSDRSRIIAWVTGVFRGGIFPEAERLRLARAGLLQTVLDRMLGQSLSPVAASSSNLLRSELKLQGAVKFSTKFLRENEALQSKIFTEKAWLERISENPRALFLFLKAMKPKSGRPAAVKVFLPEAELKKFPQALAKILESRAAAAGAELEEVPALREALRSGKIIEFKTLEKNLTENEVLTAAAADEKTSGAVIWHASVPSGGVSDAQVHFSAGDTSTGDMPLIVLAALLSRKLGEQTGQLALNPGLLKEQVARFLQQSLPGFRLDSGVVRPFDLAGFVQKASISQYIATQA